MENWSFNQNRKCEYFPCHSGIAEDDFNCLFCYCPLYPLGDQCGGNFQYLENGIKDCSGCLRPHQKKACEEILKKLPAVLELAKKP